MRGVAPLLVLALASAAAGEGERVFVEAAADRAVHYVGQPIHLTVRVGVESGFLDEGLIPLFRQPLDVPVQVQAPWLDELPGAEALHTGDVDGVSLALNDGPAAAVRVPDVRRDGRTYEVLELRRTFVAHEPGAFELEVPRVRYAFATGFRDDFINGRVAADRHEGVALGEPFALEILGLPDEGRPASFTGAVGTFTVSAAADRTRCAVGETLKLTLTFRGDGNLTRFSAPPLDALPGFHNLGAIDDRGTPVRRVTYELSPRSSGAGEIPAIPFAFFDPGPPAAYREVRTAPVPVEIVAGAGPVPAPETAPEPGARIPEPASDGGAGVPIAIVCGLALLAVTLLLRRRRRAAVAQDPVAARAEAAAAAVREAVASEAPDLADALAGYLAARLDCPPAAVIAPDLDRRLERAGVDATRASDAARLMERLVAVRYGGDAPDRWVRDAVLRTVDALEGAFAEPRREVPER